MNLSHFIRCFNSFVAFSLGSTFLVSTAFANAAGPSCVDEANIITPINTAELKALDEAIQGASGKARENADSAANTPNESEHGPDKKSAKVAMQIGLGGNPDVDKGKPFREKSWLVSVLYPVKATHVGSVPTTIYVEARCASLGKQPASAYTDNINVRCGPGLVSDSKMAKWLSTYARIGLVTSRFSHNGAPKGQINPKTGKEFRSYENDTWFTGAAIGAGVKIKVLRDTQLFAEYTKYYVQQTDNVAYQFRGGYNAGISRQFWFFQGPKK